VEQDGRRDLAAGDRTIPPLRRQSSMISRWRTCVEGRLEAREDEARRPVPREGDPLPRRRFHQRPRQRPRPTTSIPKRAAIFSTFREAVTGTPTSPLPPAAGEEADHLKRRRVGEDVPLLVHQEDLSPPVSSIAPKSADREREIVARCPIPLSNSSCDRVMRAGSRMAFSATVSTPSCPRILGR